MKKQKVIIGSLAVAALLAAGIAYLILTDDGEEILQNISGRIKDAVKNAVSDMVSDKTGVSKKTIKKVADHVA